MQTMAATTKTGVSRTVRKAKRIESWRSFEISFASDFRMSPMS